MIENQQSPDFEFKACVTTKTTELLAALVRSCRKLGLFYYPNILAQYRDTGDETLTLLFVEEAKRFNLSLYKLGRKLSVTNVGHVGSIQECSNTLDWRVLANELQFPMPKRHGVWDATTRIEWDSVVPAESFGLELNEIAENTWISRSADLLEYI